MNQAATAAEQAKQNKAILKNNLAAPAVQEQFRNALGKKAPNFIANIIDLYNSDSKLQQCDPNQVILEASKAAIMDISLCKSLGWAFIIPFNNSKKIVDPQSGRESWIKVVEPTFQIGYKGLMQLAIRSGQYTVVNADIIREGDPYTYNDLTGVMESVKLHRDQAKPAVGYYAHIELLNGFKKSIFMSVHEMAVHAKRFSQGLQKNTTVESLEETAKQPVSADTKAVGWTGNFNGMALKTVLRLLLTKYGILSIEMQQAITVDADSETSVVESAESTSVQSKVVDMDEADFQDVNQHQAPQPQAQAKEEAAPAMTDINPGF